MKISCKKNMCAPLAAHRATNSDEEVRNDVTALLHGKNRARFKERAPCPRAKMTLLLLLLIGGLQPVEVQACFGVEILSPTIPDLLTLLRQAFNLSSLHGRRTVIHLLGVFPTITVIS